ncbi:hypothetical protein J7F03_19350 [Streptomyces sp. ISL-43]|uniref:hypothetical protein n=1 Tax=Streptomyces sp. ISL-43 TaxID=2819183 RepID=UPI001BE5D73C|nr:hypothetical protein [Streptomyces sp. ISL-43]MBT2449211.1 hypothetical protein [Streptomyces sp. ISL-43]
MFTPPRTSRRTLLTAGVALPAAALSAPLLASPAAAAEPFESGVVVQWKPVTLASDITVEGAHPQVRVVRVAGTEFLQLRGTIKGSFTADFQLGTLPDGVTTPKMTRGVCPRNSHNGLNTCRVEADIRGVITILGARPESPITWVQLDNFSSVMR